MKIKLWIVAAMVSCFLLNASLILFAADEVPAVTKIPMTNLPAGNVSVGWENDCSAITGWYDVKTDAGFMAKIDQVEPSTFKVTQAGSDTWGKVAFVVKGVDLDATPIMEIKVNKVDIDSAYKVCVGSLDWKEFYEVIPRSSADGIFRGDIKKATGWTGTKDFDIIIVVEGKGKGTWFDNIKIIGEKKEGGSS